MSKYENNETLLNYRCFRSLENLEGDFFRSLEIFYLERGYLTPAQRQAVKKAQKNQRVLYDLMDAGMGGLEW